MKSEEFDQQIATDAQMTGAEINEAVEALWDAGERPQDDETDAHWLHRMSLRVMLERYDAVRKAKEQ